ncbi:MAG: glycosyltransferase family 2 protein, partial [Saprospiraceae bacterium]
MDGIKIKINQKLILLSIVICTYNREELLKKCLNSLIFQMNENIEIIIVDNNSIDETYSIASEFKKSNSNIRYVLEPINGLSNARNRGIKESKSDWILYLDDDGVAFPNLVDRALYLVERGDFDCVGGMYYGYADGEKPKWFPTYFGTKDKYSDTLSVCPYTV